MDMQYNYLFTTWEGGGNVTPALEAVRKLLARGHRVRVMSDACNQREVEGVGATFVSWNRAPSRADRHRDSQVFQDWAAPTPQEGLLSVIRDLWAGPALRYAQDTLDELRREPADLVVTVEALFGVLAACESVGQAFVTLSPNVSLSPIPGIPPVGPGLPPARTEEERAMHAAIREAVVGMFDSGLPALNTARAELGLPPLEHLLEQFDAARLELLATSRAFDFPSDSPPEKLRYVGPQLADPAWTVPWSSPWPADDARPLVVVGFSTTFQNHAGVLQKIIDALEPLPVRVLVTLAGSIREDELRAGANCVLVESAPHSAVMPQAAAFITHGGHGTVIRALAHRLPLLVIPLGRDQNDNAARVTTRGAGLSLTPDASVEAIREACQRLLEDPAFAAGARKLGDQVAEDALHSSIVQELEAAAAASQLQTA
jgi:MGT family glycosyltransferase